MFDSYRINRGPEHVSVSVTEKRAPTDESVRLLREMEAAAEKRVLEAVRVSDTKFECVIHSMKQPLSGETMLRAIFKLNGEKLVADYTAKYGCTAEDALIGLRDAVAKKIANSIAPMFSRLSVGRSF